MYCCEKYRSWRVNYLPIGHLHAIELDEVMISVGGQMTMQPKISIFSEYAGIFENHVTVEKHWRMHCPTEESAKIWSSWVKMVRV